VVGLIYAEALGYLDLEESWPARSSAEDLQAMVHDPDTKSEWECCNLGLEKDCGRRFNSNHDDFDSYQLAQAATFQP
jgi:hypothetical protein